MMCLQVKEIMISGARAKVLVKEGIPVYYPNLFVTLELSVRSINTQKKYLESIVLLENFLENEKIDLIVLTAAQNGLEPISYLTAVLTKMPNIKGNESIDHLLPWNLTQEQLNQYLASMPSI